MTDTQRKDMVGAHGVPEVNTPSLDRLASEGIRFERAYTACPLCTPARGAMFTGQHPQVNGAICNNVSPHKETAVLGTIFSHYGHRSLYAGKWHLPSLRALRHSWIPQTGPRRGSRISSASDVYIGVHLSVRQERRTTFGHQPFRSIDEHSRS